MEAIDAELQEHLNLHLDVSDLAELSTARAYK
eukprot:SAG31_NODE_34535_length_332_cov_0.648069_1_plen_32_part_01